MEVDLVAPPAPVSGGGTGDAQRGFKLKYTQYPCSWMLKDYNFLLLIKVQCVINFLDFKPLLLLVASLLKNYCDKYMFDSPVIGEKARIADSFYCFNAFKIKFSPYLIVITDWLVKNKWHISRNKSGSLSLQADE